MDLPEEIGEAVKSFLEDLKSREVTSGIGLFGSWSRGDAVQSSDVDLLVIDKADFNYEYTERINLDGVFVDLNFIPEKWIVGKVPAEIDQKIYEAKILFDRSGYLTRVKDWMEKAYWTYERVDLRTESHLINAYTYISRATSAASKEDYKSASIYIAVGLEETFKILADINMSIISNSRFIRSVTSIIEKTGLKEAFALYLEAFGLENYNRERAEETLDLFRHIWSETSLYIKDVEEKPYNVHPKVAKTLRYYYNENFFEGFILRSEALIEEESFIESGRYILRVLTEILENYVWFRLLEDGVRFDYTTLLSSLRKIHGESSITSKINEIFRIEGSPSKIKSSLDMAKRIIDDVRRKRSSFIKEKKMLS